LVRQAIKKLRQNLTQFINVRGSDFPRKIDQRYGNKAV